MLKRFIALFLAMFALGFQAREIIEKGTYELYLNGVLKGQEDYKVIVDQKKDTYELLSELRFKYPYPTSKRGYIDLKVYPYYDAVLSTGEFLRYEYRSKAEDFSKMDLVETEKSATELIDQEYRVVDVFNAESQRTDNVMQDRIDLGVNAGYAYPAGKVLRFSQTRLSSAKKKDEALPQNLILLEPYGFCLYKLLADKLKTGGPRWDFMLAIPQFMRLRPSSIEYQGTLSSYVGGTAYILKHYNVMIEEKHYTSFWVDKDNVVVQVSVPTEGVVAIRRGYTVKPFEKEEFLVSKENIEIAGTNFNEKQLRVESASGAIGATLTLPQTEGPFPVVLMVQDFLPVDRDGNIPSESGRKASPWKQIAFSFASKGIATLRFDSRGISESPGDPALLNLDGRVGEINALFNYIKNEPKIDNKRIFIFAQGLGGWSALKALRTVEPAGVIYLAFPMKNILRIWKEQVSLMQNLEGQQSAYGELDSLENSLNKQDKEWETFRGSKLYIPVIRDLSLFDPAEEIRKLAVPALFIYPDRDNVILPFHGEILDNESGGKFKPVYLKGLGHALTAVEENGNQKALVEKNLLDAIYDFVLKTK